jgi:hypothetical protein
MKKIVFILALISIWLTANSQTNYFPKGAYMSFEEIINRNPSKQLSLRIVKRTRGEIKMNGGNDYKFESNNDSIPQKTIKKEIWAYSLGDTLYLNCLKFAMQTWYAPLISDGKYLVLKAGLSNFVEEQKKQREIGYSFGAVGGAIQGAKLATLRFLYVIDKNTQKAITVTTEKMQEILGGRNDLLTQFNAETKKDDEQVLIKYLILLNEYNNL